MFKSFRPAEQRSILPQSDLLYQMWQAFIAARKANAGDPFAQHELGIRYLTGRGVEHDTASAAYWIAKAASQNIPSAKFNLAILLYHGWGTPWNPFEAFRQFLSAANDGMPEAELAAGEMYMENLIVARNPREAKEWLTRASDAGSSIAAKALADFGKQGFWDDLEKSGAKKNRSGAKNDSLGLVYVTFDSDTSRLARDENVLQDAIRNATPEIRKLFGLGRLLEGEIGSDSLRIDSVKAAAEAGSPEALALLARCAEKGIGQHKDPVAAARGYIRAIRLDYPRASRLLVALISSKEFFDEIKSRSARHDPHSEYVWAALAALGFEADLARGQAFITGPQALALLGKAAAKGDMQSMIELGLCSYNGRWAPQDRAKAIALWREAAAKGSEEALVRLAVHAVLTGGIEEQPLAEDVAALQKASGSGSLLAEVGLGYCFETGKGVTRDLASAARLYRLAAERGSQDGFRALRRLHDAIRPADPQFVFPD